MTIPHTFAYGSAMTWNLRPLLVTLGLFVLTSFSFAQEPAKEDAATKDGPVAAGPALSTDDLSSAEKTDALSIPTPGELMAAINKLGKPDWASAIRPPITIAFSSRPQMALNIGGLIADGFLAVEAEDAQQVKNIGKDIINLAKPLGVQQDILNRGKSLTDFAERSQWNTLKEELEATQNEVKTAMTENKDSPLIVLVTLGGWVRAIEAMADYVARHYTVEGARLLRQPAVARFLVEKVQGLPDKVRDDPAVRKAKNGLLLIEKAVSFPANAPPSQEAVKELSVITENTLKEIATKK